MITNYNTRVMAPPEKKVEDKRRNAVKVMFTDDELAMLRKKAFAAGGLNISAYIRQMALSGFYRSPTTPVGAAVADDIGSG